MLEVSSSLKRRQPAGAWLPAIMKYPLASA